MTIRRAPHVAVLLLLVSQFAGCGAIDRMFCAPSCHSSERAASSLVDFLYPTGQLPPADEQIPELRIPLRVGLSMLPSQTVHDVSLTAAQKEEAMQKIRERFRSRKFVAEIVVIPDYYLASKKGFEGLQALQRLYNIDVLALISYDQVAAQTDNKWSLGYLTIVGSYVIKGSHHDVSTLVDLAVVDPTTRSLIIRAGGVDTRSDTTSLIDLDHATRTNKSDGFLAATDQLVEHFDAALTQFEADVANKKANVHIVRRAGASSAGVGAMNWQWLAAFALLLSLRLAYSRKHSEFSGICGIKGG
jgi:rhombotail lipoprotein